MQTIKNICLKRYNYGQYIEGNLMSHWEQHAVKIARQKIFPIYSEQNYHFINT